MRRSLASAFVRGLRDHRGERWLARQRRRQPRDRAALLVGCDPKQRQALASALVLPLFDLAAKGIGREPIAGADEYAAAGSR